MTRIMLISAFALSGLLFAAENGTDASNFSWSDLTALAIVAVVLIFIVTKMLPDMHRKLIEQSNIFAETIKEVQTHFSDVLDKIDARMADRERTHHDDQVTVAKSLLDLTTQCARRQSQEKPPL